jgi:hypothetical protein
MGHADQSVDRRQLGLALEEVESSQGTSFGCSTQLSAQMIFIRLSARQRSKPMLSPGRAGDHRSKTAKH